MKWREGESQVEATLHRLDEIVRIGCGIIDQGINIEMAHLIYFGIGKQAGYWVRLGNSTALGLNYQDIQRARSE